MDGLRKCASISSFQVAIPDNQIWHPSPCDPFFFQSFSSLFHPSFVVQKKTICHPKTAKKHSGDNKQHQEEEAGATWSTETEREGLRVSFAIPFSISVSRGIHARIRNRFRIGIVFPSCSCCLCNVCMQCSVCVG